MAYYQISTRSKTSGTSVNTAEDTTTPTCTEPVSATSTCGSQNTDVTMVSLPEPDVSVTTSATASVPGPDSMTEKNDSQSDEAGVPEINSVGQPRFSSYPMYRVGGGDMPPVRFVPDYRQNFGVYSEPGNHLPGVPVFRRPSELFNSNFRMRIPAFNGHGNWSTFIKQFEALAVGCKWSPDDTLVHLWSSLSGQAADFAFALKPEIFENYEALVFALDCRFREFQTRETSQRLFHSRMLNTGEAVRKYAADLKFLIHRAYPQGLSDQVREDMLMKQFFDGLNDESARYRVKCLQRPRCLDDAVDLLLEYQGYPGNDKKTYSCAESESGDFAEDLEEN